MSNVACSYVDKSNTIPVHPITAGSEKLQDLLIREAEETLENNIRARKKSNRKRESRAKGQLPNFMAPSAR